MSRESDGKSAPPIDGDGGPGSLQPSRRGSSTPSPSILGPPPLHLRLPDDQRTPPSGGRRGPLHPSGQGGRSPSQVPTPTGASRKSSSEGRSSSDRTPIPSASETTWKSLFDEAVYKGKITKKKRGKVSSVPATPVEGKDNCTAQADDIATEEDTTASKTPTEEESAGKMSDTAAPLTVEHGSTAAKTPEESAGKASDFAAQPVTTEQDPTQSEDLANNEDKSAGKASDFAAQPATEQDHTQSEDLANNEDKSAEKASVEQESSMESIPSETAGQSSQRPVRNERSIQPASPMAHTQPVTNRETLKSVFQEFLENQGTKKVLKGALKGELLGYYEAKVKIMALCGCYVLNVKFQDLLKDKKYADLAMEIANDADREHGWLQAVAQDFMMRSFTEEDRGKLRFCFSGKPEGMLRMKNISRKQLVRKVRVILGKDEVHALTALGRNVYLAVLLHILDSHDKGISWRGKFELQDIYILVYRNSYECWIAKETGWEGKEETSFLDWCNSEDKVLDLHQLDSVLTDCYIDGESIPLYFQLLRDDLQRVGVIYLDKNPWFILYLRFHVALMTSMARKFLIKELFHLMSVYKLLQTSVFERVELWIQNLWSKKDSLLEAVYKHENPAYEDESPKKEESGKQKKMAGNSDTTKPKHDRYGEKLGSALSYKRHLISHLHNNVANAHLIEDFEAIEMFAAFIMPTVLPKLIQLLLKENNMTGRYAPLWSNYCTMRSNMAA